MVPVLYRMGHPCDPLYTRLHPPELTRGQGASLLLHPYPFCSILACVEALDPAVRGTIDRMEALGRGIFSPTPSTNSSAEQSWGKSGSCAPEAALAQAPPLLGEGGQPLPSPLSLVFPCFAGEPGAAGGQAPLDHVIILWWEGV